MLWLNACRPKTLVASIVPVAVGGSMALCDSSSINWFLLTNCLLFSILVQIGTNLANDYFDFKKGADQNRHNAPSRITSSGLIAPTKVRNMAYLILLSSFIVGLFILSLSNAPSHLIWVGLASVVCAVIYTGGPFPLAYNGLGDVFVVLFFGIVAVEGTRFVLLTEQNLIFEPNLLVGLACGLVINTLLVLNNYRDYDEDKINRKRTLVVIGGRKFGYYLYVACFGLSIGLIPLIESKINLLLFCLPIGFYLVYQLPRAKSKSDFDRLLSLNALLVLLFGAITPISLLISY